MWPAIAILGGLNLGMSALKAKKAAEQRQQEAMLRAAEIEAAPYTGRGASTTIATASPNVWAEMAGAGINTAGQIAALQGAGLFNPSDAAAASATSSMASPKSPYTLMQNRSYMNPWEQPQQTSSTLWGR